MIHRQFVRAASTSAAAAGTGSAGGASTLLAYLLLSRPPTILRSPNSFESAYHAYNSKLQQALSQPFPREIYFKKGSAAETTFLEEERRRRAQALGSGKSQSGNMEGKGDDTATAAAATTTDAQPGAGQLSAASQPRRTKADEEGLTDTLERSLDRSLFLVVKGGGMGTKWTLPFAKINSAGEDALHKVAPDAVRSILGKKLDIWMITNLPVGLVPGSSKGEEGYVMRAHILSGHPDKAVSSSKGVEFAWLTREEIQERMASAQYQHIQDLLSA